MEKLDEWEVLGRNEIQDKYYVDPTPQYYLNDSKLSHNDKLDHPYYFIKRK